MKLIFEGKELFGRRGPAGPDGTPIGTIISYLGLTAPADYLACDGGEHAVADYPALAAFFQEQFGAKNHFGGDGETTFAVPDFRNLFLRGYRGEAEEQLSGELGARQEGTNIPRITGTLGVGFYSGNSQYVTPSNTDADTGPVMQVSGVGTQLSAGAGSMTYTARPVNAAVLYCIKAAEEER